GEHLKRGVETWLADVFRAAHGPRVLVAPPGAGASTALGHAAREHLRPPPTEEAARPRPLIYFDAAAPPPADHCRFLARFFGLALKPPLVTELLPSTIDHPATSDGTTPADVRRVVERAGACLVIDHAGRMPPDVQALVLRLGTGMTKGAVLCVVPE